MSAAAENPLRERLRIWVLLRETSIANSDKAWGVARQKLLSCNLWIQLLVRLTRLCESLRCLLQDEREREREESARGERATPLPSSAPAGCALHPMCSSNHSIAVARSGRTALEHCATPVEACPCTHLTHSLSYSPARGSTCPRLACVLDPRQTPVEPESIGSSLSYTPPPHRVLRQTIAAPLVPVSRRLLFADSNPGTHVPVLVASWPFLHLRLTAAPKISAEPMELYARLVTMPCAQEV